MDFEQRNLVDSRLSLDLPSDLDAIEETVDRVVDHCADCPGDRRKLLHNFRIGLTEALSNAMLYGNGRDPEKRVRVDVRVKGCSITARVTDQGNGFDPSAVPDPTRPAHIHHEGGRGLFLMRALMDEVVYNDRGNCVTLTLRLQSIFEPPDEATT